MYNLAGPEHQGCKKGRGEEIPSKSQNWVTYLLHPEHQSDLSAVTKAAHTVVCSPELFFFIEVLAP